MRTVSVPIIETEDDLSMALARAEALLDVGGPEIADELRALTLVIEAFEDKHHPIGLPDPVEAIKFTMDQRGLEPKDLIPYIGSQPRVSDVLNRRRKLSIAMIRRLHRSLGIPLESLIGEGKGEAA